MPNYKPFTGGQLLTSMIKEIEQHENDAKFSLAAKLAVISEQNDKTPQYNQKQTWTSTMLENYRQVIDKAEDAAKEGKREVYIDIQYNSENAAETACILKCLRDIDGFKVNTIKLQGTGVEPNIDFESTIKVEW